MVAARTPLTGPGLPISPRPTRRPLDAAGVDDKVRGASTLTSRAFALSAVATVGLGLVACTTHSAGKPALTGPSPSRPTLSAVAPTHPAPGTGAPTQPTATDRPPCAEENQWGAGPRDGGMVLTPVPVYLARAGQHDCYDRVVFDLNGPANVGYTAKYVPIVRADASGAPVPVAGGAALQVVVRGPISGTDNQGHQPWRQPPAVGQDLIAPTETAGWASLTEVKFAGSSEGQTTFAVGVHEQRPFRVSTTTQQNYAHVIVDIAHPHR
jgi:hypothetical protein